MKKVLIIVGLVIVLLGSVITLKSQADKEGIGIEKYNYENHEYLIFYRLHDNLPIGVVHSGKCTSTHFTHNETLPVK